MNTLIIVVISKYNSLQNSQSFYKVSLAIADILYAVMIIPTTLISLFFYTDTYFSEECYYGGNRRFLFSKVEPSESYYSYQVTKSALFLFLLVSLYTLLVASIDRFYAVVWPVKYLKRNMKLISKVACVAVWLFCITLACIPFFQRYGSAVYFRVIGIPQFKDGYTAGMIYGVLLGVPFILMVLVSFITYLYVKKHIRKAKRLHSRTSEIISIRSTKTLIHMVAGFSSMTLPLMTALIFATVTSTINPNKPREFNIHTYNAIDTLGIIGYLCLTCSTVVNFFIYNTSNDLFRKCIVKIMEDISKKLRFRCLTIKLCRKRNINKTTIVPKTAETSVMSISTSPKESFELNNINSSAD